ncbi:unnamed protein product [Camellia sinensis]
MVARNQSQYSKWNPYLLHQSSPRVAVEQVLAALHHTGHSVNRLMGRGVHTTRAQELETTVTPKASQACHGGRGITRNYAKGGLRFSSQMVATSKESKPVIQMEPISAPPTLTPGGGAKGASSPPLFFLEKERENK